MKTDHRISRAEYKAPEPGSRLWNRYFLLIVLMSSAVNFGNYIVGSSFSLWIIDSGGSNTSYGIIHSAFSFVVLLARPITGWIVDHGNRKLAFILSCAVFSVTMILMYISPIFAIFVSLRLIQGAGNGCAITVCNSSAYDFIPPDKLDKGIGYITLFSSLISAATATVSIGIYNQNGPLPLVMLSVCSIAIGIVLSLGVVFRTPAEPKKFRFREVFVPSRLFDRRAIFPGLLSAFSVYLAFGLRSFVAPYGRSLGFANPGWFMTISALGMIVVRFVLDKLPRTPASGKRRVLFAYLVFAVYLILLAACANLIMFYSAAVLWAVIFGVLTPELQSIAVRAVPPDRRGAASSTFFCSSDIGIIMGSYFGGLAADHWGYRAMFLAALIPVGLCVAAYLFISSRAEKAQ